MSVFDTLKNKMPAKDDGRKLAAMGSLPSPHRKLIRMMLREADAMRYDSICEAVDVMPVADRMSREDLDAALETLTLDGWLIKRGEGEGVSYEANLGFKPPSTLSKALWSTLGSKIQQGKSMRDSGDS